MDAVEITAEERAALAENVRVIRETHRRWDFYRKQVADALLEKGSGSHEYYYALEMQKAYEPSAYKLQQAVGVLLATVAALERDNERLREYHREIQMTRVLSSTVQGWAKCLELADAALEGKQELPNSDKVAALQQEVERLRVELAKYETPM